MRMRMRMRMRMLQGETPDLREGSRRATGEPMSVPCPTESTGCPCLPTCFWACCRGFLYRTYAYPVVGLSTLSVILLTYFGRVHFRGDLPGGLVAVALGTASWILGIAPAGAQPPGPSLALPVPVASDLLQALQSPQVLTYLSVIVPMGLFNVIGSLQNIESAEAAGDNFPTAPSLAVNGTGTLLASLFGSCFPTTLYIGHPGWKAMGARAGYSILNGVILSILIFTGTLSWLVWSVPGDAGMAIVLWIGIVISARGGHPHGGRGCLGAQGSGKGRAVRLGGAESVSATRRRSSRNLTHKLKQFEVGMRRTDQGESERSAVDRGQRQGNLWQTAHRRDARQAQGRHADPVRLAVVEALARCGTRGGRQEEDGIVPQEFRDPRRGFAPKALRTPSVRTRGLPDGIESAGHLRTEARPRAGDPVAEDIPDLGCADEVEVHQPVGIAVIAQCRAAVVIQNLVHSVHQRIEWRTRRRIRQLHGISQ